jgi:hypothetical protein
MICPTRLLTLLVSFVAGIAQPSPLLAARGDRVVDKQTALQTATSEVRRRGLVLPVDYKTEVIKSAYEPEVGSASPLFAVTFFGGRAGHRIHLYMVTVDRRNGEVDYVSNHLTSVEATSIPRSLSTAALRIATSEIRRRGLLLPNGYKTELAPSVLFPEKGPDKSVVFVTFLNGRGKGARQLYKVAVNRKTMKIEFVFDFVARTMD